MNLMLNASNLRFGGGITVALQLLQATTPIRSADKIYIIAPAGKGYEKLARFPNVHMIYVPERFHSNWAVKWYYNRFVFRKWAKQLAIDRIVSLGNIAFPSAGILQLLLIQNAYLLHESGPVWERMNAGSRLYNRFMIAYTKANLRHAHSFALQTKLIQRQFCTTFNIPADKTFIIPNVLPAFPAGNENHALTKSENGIRLLVLSKYYPHKNLEILLPLARLIQEKKLPITISITISQVESAGAAAFAQQVKQQHTEKIILLTGHVSHKDIPAIYEQHDALLLPTLLESFSGSYLEAMHFRKPIFTSDLDFAKEICGDAAYYFDPLQPSSILDIITQAFADPEKMQQKIAAGSRLLAAMPSLHEVAAGFSEIIDTFGSCAE
ncbi:glycosyltransferase [Chitinophagaceae bacterium MMS25-I14]